MTQISTSSTPFQNCVIKKMRVNQGRKFFFSHYLILGVCYHTPDHRIRGRQLALLNIQYLNTEYLNIEYLNIDGACSNPRASMTPGLAKGWVTLSLSLCVTSSRPGWVAHTAGTGFTHIRMGLIFMLSQPEISVIVVTMYFIKV